MAAKLTPQQSPQAPPSSFWQLISGVAHDLDLMLQDLFPDSIPSPLREEYGLTNDFTLDETLANHPSLLEQFMRGAGDETCAVVSEDSCGEYRSSKSVLPESPTSDSYDGRTTPTTTNTSSPSPPPPAPPPRTPHYPDYSANLHCMASSGDGQTAMVSSSSVSSVQETSDGDSSQTSSSFAPCDIGLLERLIRTHPIWFLPGIGRAGAVHLLQGKDIGNFIVRQSSKPNTMALSVRLPESKGPYVEHYLIETVGDAQLRLEGSDNNFHAIPMLVAHYCQCCDELPVQLCLPRPLAQAGSRHELSSLALLGQDFWLSSLVQSPTSGMSFVPFSNSCMDDVQHSTFKPNDTGGKRSGPSPPSTLALPSHSQPSQKWQSSHQSPSSSSPPPPVAPKYQPRGVPPPPPPRSFPVSRSSSSANVPNAVLNLGQLSDHSSPTNNNEFHQKDCNDDEKLTNSIQSSNNSEKTEKKIATVSHYKQSNIVDWPSAYYKSSLADKISDYEDIWGNTLSKDKEKKPNFETFHLPPKNDSCYIDSLRHRNIAVLKLRGDKIHSKFRYTYTQGTQTESTGGKCINSLTSMSSCQVDVKELVHVHSSEKTSICGDEQDKNDTSCSSDEDSRFSPVIEGNFSSPFYAEPVDSLPFRETLNKRNSMFSTEISPLPQRFFNHRFSDPNLHWPQNASCRKVDTLDEERIASLSSSVDNIKGLGPSSQHRIQQSIGFNSEWVQELHQRIPYQNLPKKDGVTQVSNNDLYVNKLDGESCSSPQKNVSRIHNNSSWPLDSSWEWLAQEDSSDDEDIPSTTLESKFPLHIQTKQNDNHLSDSTTVEDIIAVNAPELKVPDIKPLTKSNVMRVSEYDNLGCPPDPHKDTLKHRASDIGDDAATEFSEPWDSLRWERLLRLVIPETDILGDDDTIQREKTENHKNCIIENNERNQAEQSGEIQGIIRFEDTESVSAVSAYSGDASEVLEDTSVSEYPTMALDRERNRSFQERLEPLLAAQRVVALRNKNSTRVGENIRQYIFRLSEERNNTFAMSIENFIQCTKESNESNPTVVMRNIRQFMSGMKNYLVKHGEGRFEQLVQEERSKLKSDEFLNIDAIIEGSLHKLVIKPLKSFIYQLFVNEYTKNGSLKLLSDNIKFARTKSPEELGVRPEFKPPEGASLEVVHHFLNRLQQAYSPLKKLENLLAAISTIYNSVQQDKMAQGKDHTSLGADDFLPIFICVLVRCGLIAAEIEADYMWGLLHPSLMSGEGGYYLTTLSSAVHVLKSLQACSPDSPIHSQSFSSGNVSSLASTCIGGNPSNPKATGCKTSSPEPRLPCIADLQGFMKIMIPDELTGNIISKTLPVRPNMTTKEVGKMIAHKFNVTNPQDYCLFKLVKGEETLLGDGDCPQTIKADYLANGIDCLFAYKRCDAKFVWPVLENS